MSQRFFVSPPIEGDQMVLTGREAHHLLHVMRGSPGDSIVLFDGRGMEYRAAIDYCGRNEVTCTILERRHVDRELPFPLTIAVPLPKGDRQRWLVEKAVELGVHRLIPLITRRAIVKPAPSTITRLRQTIIESSKQCGRNVLMEISEPQGWDLLVEMPHSRRLIAHPHTGALETRQSTPLCRSGLAPKEIPNRSLPPETLVAIGPEGGFAEDEIKLAQNAGWSFIDLGPRILRVETAAVAIVAAVVLPETVPDALPLRKC